MKKILQLLLFMPALLVQAQSNDPEVVKFEHTGGRAAYVKPGSLQNGNTIGDVLAQFNVPKFRNEIEVVAVDIRATHDGKVVEAGASDENFTREQKTILSSA